MDLVGLGSVLAGVGGLASGINGILSGGEATGSYDGAATRDVSRVNKSQVKQLDKWRFGGMLRYAKKAGIHPLTALGVQPISMPIQGVQSFSEPSRRSESFAAMGQGLSKMLSAYQSPAEKRMAELALEKMQLDVEGGHLSNDEQLLRNMAAAKTLRDINQSPTLPSPAPTDNSGPILQGQGDATGVTMTDDVVTRSKSMGTTAGTHPFGTHYVDSDGYIWDLISTNASEPLESDFPNAVRRSIQVGGQYVQGWFRKPQKPNIKLAPGHYLAYNKPRGQWRVLKRPPSRRKSGKNASSLSWDKPYRWIRKQFDRERSGTISDGNMPYKY